VLLDLPVEGLTLPAGHSRSVPVEVLPQHSGILCSLLIFEFKGERRMPPE
jgi:hypothetical protein